MNTTSTSTTFYTENKKGLLVLLVLFLLSSVGMFGQAKAVVVPTIDTTVSVVAVSSQHVVLDSEVDFVNWFMGSKQLQTTNNTTTTSSSIERKKQIISSGVTPNKVLYRTFVKRVMNQESTIS